MMETTFRPGCHARSGLFLEVQMNRRQLVMAILTFLFNVASVILEELH